jgi:chemotaxis-related protein WspB
LVQITTLPRLPAAVAGVLNYRGTPLPVIDLSQLALQRPALKRLSTRIIVVHFPDEGGNPHLLGLIAEQVTGTVRREPASFTVSGVNDQVEPHLGPVAMDPNGFVQWTDLNQLVPAAMRQLLFNSSPVLS